MLRIKFNLILSNLTSFNVLTSLTYNLQIGRYSVQWPINETIECTNRSIFEKNIYFSIKWQKKERKNCISNRLAVLKMIRQQSSNCKYMTLSDFIYQLPPIFCLRNYWQYLMRLKIPYILLIFLSKHESICLEDFS